REQDDLVITQTRDIEGLADARAEGDDERPDLLAAEHLVQTCTLHVEHLAEQRQDGLEASVATLLGRAARGVALHDVQLAALRVTFLAVGCAARERRAFERALVN